MDHVIQMNWISVGQVKSNEIFSYIIYTNIWNRSVSLFLKYLQTDLSSHHFCKEVLKGPLHQLHLKGTWHSKKELIFLAPAQRNQSNTNDRSGAICNKLLVWCSHINRPFLSLYPKKRITDMYTLHVSFLLCCQVG